jgi:hypothetical protein
MPMRMSGQKQPRRAKLSVVSVRKRGAFAQSFEFVSHEENVLGAAQRASFPACMR